MCFLTNYEASSGTVHAANYYPAPVLLGPLVQKMCTAVTFAHLQKQRNIIISLQAVFQTSYLEKNTFCFQLFEKYFSYSPKFEISILRVFLEDFVEAVERIGCEVTYIY